MAVGIDVTIDPSGSVSGGRVAESSLDKVGKAAQQSEEILKRLQRTTEVLGSSQKLAASSSSSYAASLRAVASSAAIQDQQLQKASAALLHQANSAKRAKKETTAAGRNLQDAGYQVNDFATQVSMGGNAFMAFGIQAGQFLQRINPIVATVTTVGFILAGVLAPNLFNSKTASNELAASMESLGNVLDITGNGAVRLSDDLVNLSKTSESLTRAKLQLAAAEAAIAIDKASETVIEATGNFSSFFTDLNAGAANLSYFEQTYSKTFTSIDQVNGLMAAGTGQVVSSVESLGDQFGVNEAQALGLLRAYRQLVEDPNAENLNAFGDVFTNISESGVETTTTFKQFQVQVLQAASKAKTAQEAIDLIAKAYENFDNVAQTSSATFDRQSSSITSLAQNLAVLELEASGNARQAAIMQQAWQLGVEQGDKLYATVELIAGRIFDLAEEQRKLNEEQQAFTANQNVVESLTQQNQLIGKQGEELAVLRAQQRLNADATDEQRQEVERLARANYRQAESAKQAQQYQQDFTTVLQGTLPDFERFRMESEALNVAFQQGAIDLQEYSLAMTNLKEQTQVGEIGLAEAFNAEFQKITADAKNVEATIGTTLAGAFGTLTNQIGQATADVLLFGASGRDAAYQIASAIATQLISSLVKLGVQYALNVALGQSLATASLAATAAQATASAAMWATPAALASLATLGANAVPANTALAGTIATSKAIAAIPVPGFAEGGMAYGPGTGTSDSFTAKLSNGEFVMPQKQTRRYAGELEAMRAGAFESGGATGVPNVTIVNQTTGRIDNARAEYVSRDEVRVIIQEEVPSLVGAEIDNPYSSANRSLRNNYDVQRKL